MKRASLRIFVLLASISWVACNASANERPPLDQKWSRGEHVVGAYQGRSRAISKIDYRRLVDSPWKMHHEFVLNSDGTIKQSRPKAIEVLNFSVLQNSEGRKSKRQLKVVQAFKLSSGNIARAPRAYVNEQERGRAKSHVIAKRFHVNFGESAKGSSRRVQNWCKQVDSVLVCRTFGFSDKSRVHSIFRVYDQNT